MAEYIVLVGCDNDKTGKRFELGDTITDKDFPKKVIKAWIEKGVLALKEPGGDFIVPPGFSSDTFSITVSSKEKNS